MHRISLFYIALLIVAFLFAFLVGGSMPYFLLYISILIFLVPLFHLLISFLGIKAKLSIKTTQIYAGENLDLEYHLINKNWFTIPIIEVSICTDRYLKEKNIIFKKISLNPREKINLKHNISFKRRGYYKNIDSNINISDIYSLFQMKKRIKNNVDLYVYPNIIVLDSFKIFSDKSFGNILVQNSMFEDKTSISNLNEYTNGDAINRIHWKASAKVGFPMVKEFEKTSNSNIELFIDNNKKLLKNDFEHHLEDKIVEASLAIVNYFLNLDIDISLNSQSEKEYLELNNIKKDGLRFYLEFFSRFKNDGERNITTLIEEKMYSFRQNSVLIIVTSILDRKIGELGMKLKMKNLIPIFIIITDKSNNNHSVDLDIKNRLNEENINLYFIDHSSNIKEILEIKYE